MDEQNYFLKMIIRVMENGIYLGKIDSPEDYMSDIIDMFNSETQVFCRYEHKTVIVEDSMCNPIMNLAISNDTLYVIPAGEDNFFSCFTKVIKYVSDTHKKNKTKKVEVDENEFEWV